MRRLMLLLVLCLLPALSHAVPIQIPYSGQLSEGGTLVNGTRNFTFGIYSAATGPGGLYFQSEPLMVTGGVYHTMLNVPAIAWDGSVRWVGVIVEGTEISPRVPIGSVPYAVRTDLADRATLGSFLSAGALSYVEGSSLVSVTTTDWTEIASRTVTLPSPGLVFAQATGTCGWNSGGAGWTAQFTISETTPTSHMVSLTAVQQDQQSYAVGHVIPLGAGTHTIKFYCRKYIASPSNVTVSPNIFSVITFLNP